MSLSTEPTPTRDDLTAFLALARERFQLASEAESAIRALALDDLKFRAGDQWPADIKAARDMDKRPCLTTNRIPQFIKQVTNEQRQNKPAVQVNPLGDGGDADTAEIIEGLVRHIESHSGADVADDTAFEYAATMGFGYTRVVTELDPMSFDEQEIVIKRVKNPFTVYFDPSCQESDYSDARFAFVVEDLTKEEFKEQYPDSDVASLNDFASIGDQQGGWISKETVRIAEYFYIEKSKRTLCLLEGGATAFLEDVPKGQKVLNKRETEIQTVNWVKMNGVEKLEERVWPGKWIPIFPVLGDELDIDGERYLSGMVRDAKDPARMYNFWTSAMTESIALAPRAPYVAAEGQIEGYEPLWNASNTRNIAVLPYKPKALNSVLVPAPQRQVYEPPVQAISGALQHADNDLKSVMGIYDASLGKRGPEESAKAILARQSQGNTANLNYSDNLARMIRHRGRAIVDLIPKIYDTARILKIVDPDGSHRMVQINAQTLVKGVARIYDLTTGRYGVDVSTGPSYQSRRQESTESMLQLLQTDPQLWQVIGDLVTANMDWPGAKEISARLKKVLPPNLQDQEDGQQQIPPQVQQAMQKMQQELQAAHAFAANLHQQIASKQPEIDARIAIARMQEETKRTIAIATIDAQRGEALLESEDDAAHKLADLQQQTRQQGNDHAHALNVQRLTQAAAARQQAMQQAHDAQSQQSGQQADAQMQGAAQDHQASMADQASANNPPEAA